METGCDVGARGCSTSAQWRLARIAVFFPGFAVDSAVGCMGAEGLKFVSITRFWRTLGLGWRCMLLWRWFDIDIRELWKSTVWKQMTNGLRTRVPKESNIYPVSSEQCQGLWWPFMNIYFPIVTRVSTHRQLNQTAYLDINCISKKTDIPCCILNKLLLTTSASPNYALLHSSSDIGPDHYSDT